MSSDPVRVAVIGAGNMGRYHIRNYREMLAAELVAISDQNPEAKQLAEDSNVPYFSDHLSMFEAVQPQAVSIVVPTTYHYQIAKDALEHGIHVLVEKPISSTLRQADELIELAASSKLILTVGHVERFNPVVRKIKQLIDEGTLGTITSIVSKRVGGFPLHQPSTDVLVDLAVHDIDLFNLLLGRYPMAVHSHKSRTVHSEMFDACEILLDYGDASGFVQANWTTPVKIRTIAVTGTSGYVEGNYITQELVHYENNLKSVNSDFDAFVEQLGSPRRLQVGVEFEEPLKAELSKFVGAVLTGEALGTVSAKDAREALRIAITATQTLKPQ